MVFAAFLGATLFGINKSTVINTIAMNTLTAMHSAGKNVLWLAALIVLSALPASHMVNAASLKSELARLLQDNPLIRAAEKNLQSSIKEIDISRSSFLPTVSATGEIGPEFVDSPAERNQGDGQGGKISSRLKQSAGLTVTQSLFDGYSNLSTLRTAQLNREIAAISLEGTRQNTLFEGVRVYIDVLRQQRLIELSRENEETIQRQLNLEDERVLRGSGVAVDVLQAKSRLQTAKEKRVTLEGALQDAITRYVQVFNSAPDIETMMDPAPPVELIPSTLDRAVEISTSENPAVTNSGVGVEVAEENRRAAAAGLYPSLDLESSWNVEKDSNTTLGVRRDYSVVLKASWDLFSGFSTKNSRTQASFDYGASKDSYDDTVRKLAEQTKLAWQALLTSRQRIELLENAVNIASEVFQARKKLREQGSETVVSVLDAESEVNQAQIDFTTAAYDERLAVYQLLLAMGRLDGRRLNLALN